MRAGNRTLLTQRLAQYGHGLSFKDLSVDVVHEVKRRILDSLGCAYGALHAPPCRIARRLAKTVPMEDQGATVWGTSQRTIPGLATFVNGSLVRYLDFNDTYLSREPAHPSDNIPSCFAIGETSHSSGKEVILAIVLAYEVQCRLCDAAALRPLGWDHVTYGAFSCALATAKLLKLSPDKTAHAVSLAGVTAGALRQTRIGEVSLWKACAFANAARNGMFAGFAAREGMTGPLEIFEGEKGFMRVISGQFSLPHLGGENGTPFKILDTYIKPYPVEYHAQSAVEAAIQVRQKILDTEGQFDISLITGIEVESFDVAIEIIGRDPEKWHPKTRETADHSFPYCVAVAIMDGRVSPQSFSSKRLQDKKLRDLIQKVRVNEQPDFTVRYPDAMPTRLRVTTISGREYISQIDYPQGHPKRLLSDHDIETKFHKLVNRKIGSYQSSRLIERVWELEKLKDVGNFLGVLPVAVN